MPRNHIFMRTTLLATAIGSALSTAQVGADPYVIGRPLSIDPGIREPIGVAVGDVTGDGADDLIYLGSYSGLSVLPWNQNEGSFGTAIVIPSLTVPFAEVSVADVDGDGRKDVLVVAAQSMVVVHQTADGTLAAPYTISLPVSADFLQLADLNGDGRPDLIGGNGGFALQDENGEFFTADLGLAASGGGRVAADLDGDGRVEVVLVSGNSALVYRRGADGLFSVSSTFSMPAGWGYFLRAGDFNGDGRQDLLDAYGSGRVLLQSAEGTFDAAQAIPLEGALWPGRGIRVMDVDRDGKSEIIARESDDRVSFYKLASGQMARYDNFLEYPSVSWAVGDFGGDGLPDVALGQGLYALGLDAQRPVANAGPDRIVAAGTEMILDGSASSDPMGTITRYRWISEDLDWESVIAEGSQVNFGTVYGTREYRYKLIVWNDRGVSAADEVTLNIRDSAPVANAGADQSVKANVAVLLDGSGSLDAEGAISSYTWSQVLGPTVRLQSAGIGKLNFVAPFGDQTLAFRLSVGDLGGQQAADEVIIRVTDNPPSVNAGADKTVSAHSTVQLNGSTQDEGSLTYLWQQVSGPVVALQQSGENATFVAPFAHGSAVLAFEMSAIDQAGNRSADQVTVTVLDYAPTVSAGSDRTVVVQGPVTLLATASDGEGAIASVTWQQLSGTSVGPMGQGSSFSFPAPTQPGSLVFRVTAIDQGGNSAADEVTITVDARPVANAGADIAAAPQQSVVLDGTASSDLEGPIASYQWTQVSGPAVTLSSAGTGRVSFAAPYGSATREFQLTVTDSLGTTATDRVLVTVTDGAPTARAGADQSVTAHSTVTLDGTASSDVEGAIASFSWRQVAGPQVSLQSGALPGTASFTAPYGSGTFTFELTVTDLGGNSSVDQVVVTATDLPPTAAAGADKAVKSGNIVTLDATASSDREGPLAAYAWRQIAGTAVTLTQSGVPGRVTFTAPSVKSTTVLVFEVRVTDQAGQTAADQVNVTVSKR